MKNAKTSFWLCVLMLMPGEMLYADTVACKRGTVFVDDSRAEVLMKCGEPEGKESHQEELSERLDRSTKQKQFVIVEEWTYNFGPNELMSFVTLRNGKVTGIRTGDYGHRISEKTRPPAFSDRIISIGESTSEVLAKWGEPTGKSSRKEELKEKLLDGQVRTISISINEWTYNLGPDRLMRILIFRNGTLTEIKTGRYGYPIQE